MATPVLQLSSSVLQNLNQPYFAERTQHDNDLQFNFNQLDAFVGHTTASCYTIFTTAPSTAGPLGSGSVLDISASFPDFGCEYTRDTRVIQEVVAWAGTSGSGGVTTLDILVQQGNAQPANFSTIFKSANYADKLALSASGGNYNRVSSSLFVSGSNTLWPAGTLMKATILTAAGGTNLSGNGSKNLSCVVFWKPTGTLGV